MPEESASERTEEATPRKREQARQQGTVARSRDLSAAVILFLAVLFFKYLGAWLLDGMNAMIGSLIERSFSTPLGDADTVQAVMLYSLEQFVRLTAPFLGVLLAAGLAVNFSMVGFVVSWEALSLKFDRIDPIAGFGRMFSLRTIMQLVMSLCKVGLVLGVAWGYFTDAFNNSGIMGDLPVGAGYAHAAEVVVGLMLRLAAVLLVLALADQWYQQYQVEQDLMMTKQEIKEEMKDTEGDPHIRSRRRQIQREMARQRMMQSVPTADVVVRNPTHFAVALCYDEKKNRAPIVVAKGADHVALRIVEIAEKNNVVVRREPWLARKLFKLEVGDEVPQELFTAVAEILAYVYKQNGKADRRLAS